MKTILIAALMMFALQSKATTTDSLEEVRINDVVYVGHIQVVDNTIYVSPVNTIKVERNNSTVIYINGDKTGLKKAIITDSREPVIKVDYNIVSKFNKK